MEHIRDVGRAIQKTDTKRIKTDHHGASRRPNARAGGDDRA